MNKSLLSDLVFFFAFIATLELFFEVAEDALGVARRRRVDEFFHGIGQHVMLNSRTRKALAGHTCRERRMRENAAPPRSL